MIIIDSSIDIYGVIFSNPDLFVKKNFEDETNEQNYNIFVHLFLTQLLKRLSYFKATTDNRVVLAIDAKSWRKSFFEKVKTRYFQDYYKTKKITDEGYKAHREKSNDIDWRKIYAMLDDIVLNLNKYSDILAIKVKSAEADDVIGAITLNNMDENITIISGDKDFKQLLTKRNIKLFDGRKGMYSEVDNAELFLKKHIIMGDKADEIPAIIERVGKKTAIKMLPTIDFTLQTNQRVNFRYQINKKLIDLREIPRYITKKILNSHNEVKNSYNFDANGMIDFLAKYDCKNLISRVNEFKLRDGSINGIFNNVSNDDGDDDKMINDFLLSL